MYAATGQSVEGEERKGMWSLLLPNIDVYSVYEGEQDAFFGKVDSISHQKSVTWCLVRSRYDRRERSHDKLCDLRAESC